MTAALRIFVTILIGVAFGAGSIGFATGCGSAVGTSTGNPTSPKAQAFPANLAVASPFETVETSPSSLQTVALNQSAPFISGYDDAASSINEILNGTESGDCRFDPSLFLSHGGNANCYGPPVVYEGHPDALGPSDPLYNGELPTGDVGIWTETNSSDGHACAAAQLNSRMDSLRDRSVAGLMGLASLICAATATDQTLPDNSSLDLTDAMNNLGINDTVFATAIIRHSDASGSDEWSYELDLTYTADSSSFTIVVELIHRPGTASEVYNGVLSYRINDRFDAPVNCPTTEQTFNGSLAYNRSSEDRLQAEVRGAQFCGHDADGLSDGIVDPANRFNPGSNPNGWANNFSLFTADFEPDSLAGNYSFSWQAGILDQYTRVFNATVRSDEESGLEGDAFYGFGDDVESTDGSIAGFFCNWAGPAGRGSFKNLAQYQSLSLNQITGKFEAGASQITYAPLNACDYDGSGTFRYDSDGDGALDTDPSAPVTNDLVPLVDADADGTFDALEDVGFVLPITP